MKYQVSIPKPVQKQLDNLPDNVFKRVISRLEILQTNHRPPGCLKLKGFKGEYRIRIGDYRIRYLVEDKKKLVVILHCAHRKDIYLR